MEYVSADELAIRAVKKEYKRLSKAAEKANQLVDNISSATTEIFKLHNKLVQLDYTSPTAVKEIEKIQKKQTELRKLLQLDYIKEMNKAHQLEIHADSLKSWIANQEFMISARQG